MVPSAGVYSESVSLESPSVLLSESSVGVFSFHSVGLVQVMLLPAVTAYR